MKKLPTLCLAGLLLLPVYPGLAKPGSKSARPTDASSKCLSPSVSSTAPAPPMVAPVKDRYLGWETFKLANQHVCLQVVPAIGGRVIQYSLGQQQGFFWVNPDLAGKAPPAGGVGPDETWLSYGGDKIWLAPQGWDNAQQWPGPPDGILDGSPHAAEVIPGGLKLTSQPSPRFGVQILRTINLEADSTRVSFNVVMRNTDKKPRRWGIWEHAQLNAGLPDGTPNGKLKSYCPLNPRSHFQRGYEVIFGAQENPSWVANSTGSKAGIFTASYLYKVGKAVIDSPAGWVATVDGANGTVFVQFFQYEPGRDYPDGATIEFWHNGAGSFLAWGKENVMSADPKKNPYVAEAEVMSPFFEVAPGESCRWSYQWCAASLGGDYPVVDCTPVAAVSETLRVTMLEGDRARITGRWGVFEGGSLVASWIGKDGLVLGSADLGDLGKISPGQSLVLEKEVQAPAKAVSLKLELADASGKTRGELGRTFVPRQ